MTRRKKLLRLARFAALTLSMQGCATPADVFQNPSPRPVILGAGGPLLTYVVLGDSTSAGQGAAYADGIAMGTAATLAKSHHVVMTNLSVSGARVADMHKDQLVAAERLHPDLVLISVCANDVTHLSATASMRADLLRIVRGLKAANPNVAIVVTGSPDMGAPPRIPRLLRGLASRRTESVNVMVHDLVVEEQLTFAPIAAATGPLFRGDRTLFASDGFHPNARGYATWVSVLNEAIARALRSRRDVSTLRRSLHE
jgi:Lysophospholipase L1 and related esterases